MRAVAALSVFLYHLNREAPLPVPLDRLAGHGNIGVVLFFLISGFLLYRPFITARSGSGPPIRTARFYERRALRILPAYWVALTVLAIAVGLDGFSNHPVSLYLFTQIYDPDTVFDGIHAAWSLSIEVTFYLLLPLYAFLIARTLGPITKRAATVELTGLTIAAALSCGLQLVLLRTSRYDVMKFTLPASFYLFAAGMALAILHAGPWQLPRIPRWAAWSAAAAVYIGLSYTSTFLASLHPLYAIVAALLLWPATDTTAKPSGGVFRAMTAIGIVSYAIYLWHGDVILHVHEHTGSPWLLLVVALTTTLIIAAASYHLVEKPFLRRKRSIAARP